MRHYYGSALITASKATNATALAGNALKKHGTNPLQIRQSAPHEPFRNTTAYRQYPFHPFSRYTALAASLHRLNTLSPGSNGSVMILCFTTSLG